MYFWKVNSLVEDLKEGRVSQRQKMYYYLANTLFYLILFDINGLMAAKPNIFTTLNILLGLFLTVGGILLCYEANSQGDDKEFVDRITCLSWPINMRMLVVLMPVYFAYGLFLAGTSGQTATGIVDVFIMGFYSVYFYKWLHSCLLKISK
jgi:hypothetical protein